MESCLKRISSIFWNLQVTVILKTKIGSLNIAFIHSILSRCQDECNVNIIPISKQLNDTVKFLGLCFVLFFSSMYPNFARRQEEADCRFKGTQGENKSSFHNVKGNAEF